MITKILAVALFLVISPAWAANSDDAWNLAANAVCDQINNAIKFYEKNDTKNARKEAIMAYFKGYDAEIEPAVRVTIGASHVFEMEHKFRNFSRRFSIDPDKQSLTLIKKAASELCEAVREDAKLLNEAHIDKQVFKVD